MLSSYIKSDSNAQKPCIRFANLLQCDTYDSSEYAQNGKEIKGQRNENRSIKQSGNFTINFREDTYEENIFASHVGYAAVERLRAGRFR